MVLLLDEIARLDTEPAPSATPPACVTPVPLPSASAPFVPVARFTLLPKTKALSEATVLLLPTA